MKYRSKFKHDFTNRGCLHCAILKALHAFKEKKSPQGKRYAIFPSGYLKWDFQDFENVLSQHEIHQSSLLN